MRSGWIRRWSRAIAAVLLLTSMLQFPHRSQDDEICSPADAVSHDASKHVFTAPTPVPQPVHCAICHWTRWVKPVFSSGPAVTLGLDLASDLAAGTAGLLRDVSADRLPPRGPPAL
jgi:hypothetical protein